MVSWVTSARPGESLGAERCCQPQRGVKVTTGDGGKGGKSLPSSQMPPPCCLLGLHHGERWFQGWGEDGGVEQREGRRRTGEAFPGLWLGWEGRRHWRGHARLSSLLSACFCREFNFLGPFVCCRDLNEVGDRILPWSPLWCQSSCSASVSLAMAMLSIQLPGPKADPQIWGAQARQWSRAEHCWLWESALARP